MAIVKVIEIKGNTEQAKKSFKDLGGVIQDQKDITIEFEQELVKLEKQLNETSKSNLPAQKALKTRIVGLKDAIKDQRVSIKALNNEKGKQVKADNLTLVSATKNYGAITLLDQVTGGYASTVRNAVDSSRLFTKSLKAASTAMIATGIGALLVALALVVAYWDDIVGYITDANGKLENQLALTESITGVLDSQLATVNKQLELNKLQGKGNEQLEKQKVAILLRLREQNEASTKILKNQLERLKATSTEVGFWDAIKANVLFTLLGTKALASESKNLADQRLKEINDLESSIEKSKLKEIDLATQLYNIENPQEEDPKKEKTKDEKIVFDDSVQKQLEEEIKALEEINRTRKEFAEKNREDKLGQNELDREDKLLEIENNITDEAFKRQALFEVNKFFDNEELRIKQETADAEQKIAEDNAAALQKIEDLKERTRKKQLAGVGRSLDEAAKLAGESTAAGKALAIAGATISTFQTAQSAYQAAFTPVATVASPALGALFAGVAVAGGLANIASIAKVKVPSGGRGGSASPSAGAAPAPPSFNLVEGTENQQINDSINLTNTTPTRAFVVSADVTTAQSEDRNIVTESGI